jgi:hypothetical protein
MPMSGREGVKSPLVAQHRPQDVDPPLASAITACWWLSPSLVLRSWKALDYSGVVRRLAKADW